MSANFQYKFYEQILFYSNDNLDEYYKICGVHFDGITLPPLESLFGQKARNIREIDFTIEKIQEVIDGKEVNFLIWEECSLGGFEVNQKHTRLLEIVPNENDYEGIKNSWNNRVPEKFQLVETSLILQLYNDWRKFLTERENMIYVRK